ncbi:hypothetical protein EC968_008425 [Mortierella alpina]|nr:hypothetical protein EC968_008425 [Mortierella alpina]
MAQPFSTHRPQHEDDEDDAPPPYEATAPAVPAAAIPAHTPSAAQPPPAQQQQYPALNPPQGHVYPHQPAYPPAHRPAYQPPPAFGYYPAMAPAPAPPSPHVAYPHYPHQPQYPPYQPYQQYPHYQQPHPPQPQPHYPHQPQYPQYPHYATPQAYPSMPLHTSNGPAPVPYPASSAPAPQASAPPPAPAAAGSGPVIDGTPSSPTITSPPTVSAPEHNLIDFTEDGPSQGVTTVSTLAEAAVPAAPSDLTPGSSSSPPLPPSLAPALVPTTAVESPGLVTHYRCGKCGGSLKSETSVCKRIHTLGLSLAERQVRQATTADLENRRKSHDGTVSSAGVGAGPSTDSFSSSSSSSTAPQQGGGQSSDANSPLPHSPYAAAYAHQQQAFLPQPYQQQQPVYPYPALTAGPANNYGTNHSYLRRAVSVNPVSSLKNIWRELNQTQDYARPRPLLQPVSVPPPGPVMPYASHLGRSNTVCGPTLQPTYAPPPVVPSPPMQPWLAPSAPPSHP